MLYVNGIPAVQTNQTISRNVGTTPTTNLVTILTRDLPQFLNGGGGGGLSTVERGTPVAATPEAIGMPGGLPVTATLGERTIRDLRLIGIRQNSLGTGREATCELVLSDRRLFWGRTIASAAYNVKRPGFLRVGDPNATVERIAAAVPSLREFEYRQNTLNGGKLHTVRSALEEQFANLGEKVTFPSLKTLRNILSPIERVDDSQTILQILINQAAHAQLVLHDDGTLSIIDAADFQVPVLPYIIEDVSSQYVPDFSLSRPSAVHVYFEVECELPFYHDEDKYEVGSGYRPAGYPQLIPVVRNPVRDLVVGSDKVTEGAWLDLKQFLTAVRSRPLPFYNKVGPLTIPMIRRFRHAPYHLQGQFMGALSVQDELWIEILNATFNGFRATFRLEREWHDRIRSIIPFRTAIHNPFDLTRAASPVVTPFTMKPTRRLVFHKGPVNTISHEFVQDPNWFDPDTLFTEDTYAPMRPKVVDQQALIIAFNFNRERTGSVAGYIRGVLELSKKAMQNMGRLREWLTTQRPLLTNWGLGTVLTARPYFSGRTSCLYKVVVTPKDAQTRLNAKIGDTLGPPIEIYVPYSDVTCAKFAIKQTDPLATVRAFRDLDFTNIVPENQNMVLDIALSAAAGVYAQYLDVPEQQLGFVGDVPDFRGGMRGIASSLAADGSGAHALISGPPPAVNGYAPFANDSTRAALSAIKLI